MNPLYNTALRQSTSLRHDLGSTDSQPLPLHPSALGAISASLTAFSRTLDSYATLQRSELNTAKKDKAAERITSFRSELADFKAQYAALRTRNEAAQTTSDRGELLGRRPYGAGGGAGGTDPGRGGGTPDNPYNNSGGATTAASGSTSFAGGVDTAREGHAFREQSFLANTSSTLDEYLARGQAVLGDLSAQREVLKGTQRKLYSVANTLGVSGDTIRMVERRARQDKWIFWTGCVVFFGFCYLCIRWLR